MDGVREEAVTRYLAWAKLKSVARFNLAVSGIVDYPLAELPVRIEDIEIGGTGPYGYTPLMERLSAKAGVPEECVVYTLGTSMANYVAMTALVHRGDEVLVERPTYDPILTILDHVEAKVTRFERRPKRIPPWAGRTGTQDHPPNPAGCSLQSAQSKQHLNRRRHFAASRRDGGEGGSAGSGGRSLPRDTV